MSNDGVNVEQGQSSKPRRKLVGIAIAGVLLVLLVASIAWVTKSTIRFGGGAAVFEGLTAEVYYSPNCGCCANYISYLKRKIDVKKVQTPDTSRVKNELGVPQSLSSCHTTKIGGYFVEGHVPIEAIEKLLTGKPDIDGIALPGMPSGSPGMPGPKTAPFDIQAIKDGKSQGTFMTI